MSREVMNVSSLNNEFIQLELYPEALIRKIQRTIPRSSPYSPFQSNDIPHDPIIDDLMKLTPHRPFVLLERSAEQTESINAYSARLSELLYLLIEESGLDDSSRISIESMLFDMTSYIPTPAETWTFAHQQALKKQKLNSYVAHDQPIYPNEALSKILIENYAHLHKFSTSYFNLSLASHVTKYMVELIYSLQCWELYHLVTLIPDLEYFLKLVSFEITQTSFGPVIRPPLNYLNDDMLSGLQYPFPYPFYNYSFHSFNSKSEDKKFEIVKITPYTGVDLHPSALPRKRSLSSRRKSDPNVKEERGRNAYHLRGRNSSSQRVENFSRTDSDASLSESEEYDEDDEDDDVDVDMDDYEETPRSRRTSKVSDKLPEKTRAVAMPARTPSQTAKATDKPSDVSSSEEDVDVSTLAVHSHDASHSGDGREGIEEPLSPSVPFHGQLKFIQQSPRKSKGEESPESVMESQEDKNKKNKSSVIHQCQLTDPNTLRRCLKIFYGKNELLRHQEFVHATKKKIYKCIYCSRNNSKIQSYPRHDSLARHIRRKHGVTGKENKMAVNYAKENVEVIDDPNALVTKQHHFGKPLPHPQYLNSDFTIKPGYAGFLSFSSKDTKPPSPTARNRVVDVIDLPSLAPPGEGDHEAPAAPAPVSAAGFQTFRVDSTTGQPDAPNPPTQTAPVSDPIATARGAAPGATQPGGPGETTP